MNTFAFEIVTPAQAHPAREVVSVDAPGEDGRLTIMARHEPLVCLLRAGPVNIRTAEGGQETWSVAGGALAVRPDGVTLLTTEARIEPPPAQ
jgi:F-type H+-transporting ATPase subunit epsilon